MATQSKMGALLTAALCLLSGADLELPEETAETETKDEWIVILGGSGSVGQHAVQISKLCGYKVLASCSPSKQSVATRNGASATFNNRGSVDEQVADIQKIKQRTNTWRQSTTAPIKEYKASLGHLYRLDEPIGTQVTADMVKYIPTLEKHLAAGTLKPLQHQEVDGVGWDRVIQGIQELEAGKAEKKIVVRTQEE
ncbi:hypothetical protein ACHAPU_003106 [Fusarium lateritium]